MDATEASAVSDGAAVMDTPTEAEARSAAEQVLRLVCRAVIRETPSMSSFLMERVDGQPVLFKPGQYLTVRVVINGRTHDRCYSISSSPLLNRRVRLTVKREANGLVSKWLHDTLREGTELAAAAPAGRFTMVDQPEERPLMLSGGSGVTPIMSMLRWLAEMGRLGDAILVHCCRRSEDIAFREEFEELGNAGLKAYFLLSEEEPRPWQNGHRRICGALLRELVPDFVRRTAYICGSERFMASARAAAAETRVATIHTESFGAGQVMPPVPDQGTDPTGGGLVSFTESGVDYACATGETVLEAATACGIWLNTACRQGICGSCRSLLVSGSVEMNDLGGLTEEEKADGWILPCCSLPDGPVRVRL